MAVYELYLSQNFITNQFSYRVLRFSRNYYMFLGLNRVYLFLKTDRVLDSLQSPVTKERENLWTEANNDSKVFFWTLWRNLLTILNYKTTVVKGMLTIRTSNTIFIALRRLSSARRAAIGWCRFRTRARASLATGLRAASAVHPGRPRWPASVY